MKRHLTRNIRLIVIFLLVLGVSGCGWWKDITGWLQPSDMTRATPEGLYRQGAELYQEGRYKKAIESFQRVREMFPLHNLVVSAEIGIADSYFSNENYIEAELAYRDFISLRPTNENLPYAMFLLGMCHFRQMGAIDRDQAETIKALKEFERLIMRFPNNKFSVLAEEYILKCRKRLAEKEFYVGNFYFSRGKYKAALGRFETIAREYPGVGLDEKVRYFLEESKKRLIKQENKEKIKREKVEKKVKAGEEKAVVTKTASAGTTAENQPAADKK